MKKNDHENKNDRVLKGCEEFESNTAPATVVTTTETSVGSNRHTRIPNSRNHGEVTEENAVTEFMRTMRELMENKDTTLPKRRVYYEFLLLIAKDFSPVLRKSSTALRATANMLCSAPKNLAINSTKNSEPTFKFHDCDVAGDILFSLYQSIRFWPLPLLEIYLMDVLGNNQRLFSLRNLHAVQVVLHGVRSNSQPV